MAKISEIIFVMCEKIFTTRKMLAFFGVIILVYIVQKLLTIFV